MTKLIASLALSTLALLAAVQARKGNIGQIAQVQSAENFCFFLPPMEGGNIADNEDRAVAFCTKPMSKAPGARLFPEGFIESAHFKENKEQNWVQVTGKMTPQVYSLSTKDGGGQYDVKAPVGAACADYKYFVNMVEPDGSLFCMRCCQTKEDCPVGKSTYGCRAVIDGKY
ncbi:hypothetical protein BKA57DRAFT_434935 [Linnemannia elongata]|nr:hypothetical protein BGZ88_001199 [Linnemannia elongata]KAF9333133.1 hypothetical protein BGZ91_011389 [Linnemannia elongata]KAG0061518.1 hypothetical protein BGZ89_011389 [Linnemannia elongata]KAG0070825.1 hypothetical protein BGZ90_012496 [Linnemannia elongata]KAH7055364.1 hypothetical protein BKA57DRAFT_434935 [Linnemannia elongata]